jgi:hypothetical protein
MRLYETLDGKLSCLRTVLHTKIWVARWIAIWQQRKNSRKSRSRDCTVFRRRLDAARWAELCRSYVALAILAYKNRHPHPTCRLSIPSAFMEIAFLLHFIDLCITVFGFNVPQEWIIGLREGHTIEEHLAVVERSIDIEQYIPEINGYAIYPTEDDEATLSAIRRDLKVGFSVQKPREFFTQDGHFGLEGDDLSEYEDERLWLTLQDQDSEVIVTDDNAT